MAMLNIPRAAWASGASQNALADKEERESKGDTGKVNVIEEDDKGK